MEGAGFFMTKDRDGKHPMKDLTPTLIARLREGDSSAGSMLDGLYRKDLLRMCVGYLGNPEEAEDVVQDVFCRVVGSRTVPDSFRPWIYRIARNRCLDLIRRRAAKRDNQALPTESQLEADLTGDLTKLVRGEQRARLHHLMAALPISQREVLRLRYTERLTRAEIAEVLEIPESVVKSRLYEGLEKLRQHSSLVDDR